MNIASLQKIKIGFQQNSRIVMRVKALDNYSRVADFVFYDPQGDMVDELDSTMTIHFRMVTPTGRKISSGTSATVINSSTVRLVLTDAMLKDSGTGQGELDIINADGSILSTAVFDIIIDPKTFTNDIFLESQDMDILNTLIAQDRETAAQMKSVTDAAQSVIDDVNKNEATRQSNEDTRISNENVRIDAENARVSAEKKRVSAEKSRVSAENARVTAESNRVTANEQAITNLNDVVTRAEEAIKSAQDASGMIHTNFSTLEQVTNSALTFYSTTEPSGKPNLSFWVKPK